MRIVLQTLPPFCAMPVMSSTLTCRSSICAAMPSSAPMVTTPVPPTPVTSIDHGAARDAIGGSGSAESSGGSGRMLAEAAAMDGHETGAEPVDAGKILVAA